MLNKTKSQKAGLSARPPVLLPEPCNVNAAAAWNEGYWLLPGEVWTKRKGILKKKSPSNPFSNEWLNVQKSAEAIVP